MKKSVFPLSLVVASAILAGCSTGTTYGTGTTHEEATMKGITNIFSLKSDKSTVSYTARPDLVMPANKNILPTPVTETQNLSNEEWPESPQQRIARVQSLAPEVDERTGDLPVEYLTSEKEGINVSRNNANDVSRRNVWAKEEQWLKDVRNDAAGKSESAEFQKRKDQLAYSTGVKRKFLTEPPTEYRTPSATAEAGDLGISEEELAARKEAAREEYRGIEKAVTPIN